METKGRMLYYSDGRKRAEGNLINGKKEGVWLFYYPNGSGQFIGCYENGMKNGEWIRYYPTGVSIP